MQGGGYDQGFHEIRQISHEIRWISKLWAFAWWSSIGLSFFERPMNSWYILGQVQFLFFPIEIPDWNSSKWNVCNPTNKSVVALYCTNLLTGGLPPLFGFSFPSGFRFLTVCFSLIRLLGRFKFKVVHQIRPTRSETTNKRKPLTTTGNMVFCKVYICQFHFNLSLHAINLIHQLCPPL